MTPEQQVRILRSRLDELSRLKRQSDSNLRAAQEEIRAGTAEIEFFLCNRTGLSFWISEEGRILDAVCADESKLYAPPSAFLGRPLEEVLPAETAGTILQALSGRESGVVVNYTLEIGSEVRHFRARVGPLVENAGNRQSRVLVDDITNQVNMAAVLAETDRTYRALIGVLPAQVVIRIGSHLVFENDYFQERLNGDWASIQKSISRFLLESSEDALRQPMPSLTLGNGRHLRLQVDRQSITYHGKPAELYLLSDVSDLAESKDKLATMMGIVAHDLRSPFMGITGLLEVLLESFDQLGPVERTEMLTSIYESATRTFDMLNELLEFARLSTGGLEPELYLFDLSRNAEQVRRNLQTVLEQKGLSLDIDIPTGQAAFADERMVSTVLRNLVSNSIKFSHPGDQISMRARVEGSRLEVSVQDTGVGMEPEVLEKLRAGMSGKQVSMPGTNNEQGTGFGLITIRAMIKAMSGQDLSIESEKGVGTCMTFYLPLDGAPAF